MIITVFLVICFSFASQMCCFLSHAWHSSPDLFQCPCTEPAAWPPPPPRHFQTECCCVFWQFEWHAGRWAGKSNPFLHWPGDFETLLLTPSRFLLSLSSLSCCLTSLAPSSLPLPLLWILASPSPPPRVSRSLYRESWERRGRRPVLLQPLLLSIHLSVAPSPSAPLASFHRPPPPNLMHFFFIALVSLHAAHTPLLHSPPPPHPNSACVVNIWALYCHLTCWREGEE